MKNKLFFILDGNNGATYILNVKDADAIILSLKFYKARSIKQKVMKYALKLYLNSLAVLCQLSIPCGLKSRVEIDQYLYRLVPRPIDFELDENSSILVSPTRDKVIVHHHGQSFHKFAFGDSYDKVKNEARIYELLGTPLQHFKVSKFQDYVERENNFCSFKLESQAKSTSSDIDLTLALVEMFNASRKEGCLFSSYLKDLKNRYLNSIEQFDAIESVFNQLEATHKNVWLATGLVHRDFKPWNINEEHGLLIYDFEEALTDGPPLEDLLNYHIDPIVRYLPPLDVAETIFKKERVTEYGRYLQKLNIHIGFQTLLYCYLIERVIFWMNAGEQETSEKYGVLFEYIVMEYIDK